jgi:alanyl-tRNA synthetase
VVREANAEATRSLANAIRSRLASGAIALVGIDADAVTLFVSVSPDLVARGVHAGNLLKRAAAPLDARGGGSAAQAQGGGRNAAGAQAALAEIRAALAE